MLSGLSYNVSLILVGLQIFEGRNAGLDDLLCLLNVHLHLRLDRKALKLSLTCLVEELASEGDLLAVDNVLFRLLLSFAVEVELYANAEVVLPDHGALDVKVNRTNRELDGPGLNGLLLAGCFIERDLIWSIREATTVGLPTCRKSNHLLEFLHEG